MFKSAKNAANKAVEGNGWKKFANPTASRGKTVFPKTSAQQQSLGVRWDYDGQVTRSDGIYHKFQMQPNSGNVPASIKQWREKNGGTHAVMADVFVKKDGTQQDVEEALKKGIDSI